MIRWQSPWVLVFFSPFCKVGNEYFYISFTSSKQYILERKLLFRTRSIDSQCLGLPSVNYRVKKSLCRSFPCCLMTPPWWVLIELSNNYCSSKTVFSSRTVSREKNTTKCGIGLLWVTITILERFISFGIPRLPVLITLGVLSNYFFCSVSFHYVFKDKLAHLIKRNWIAQNQINQNFDFNWS